MSVFVHDQAEGLRRLLRPDFVRVLALAGARPGVGRATLADNLAAVLARRGRRVLVIDTQSRTPPPDLAPPPQQDLTAVLRGRKRLDDVVTQGSTGVHWLRAGDALATLPGLAAPAQDDVAAQFQQMGQALDVVLIDAAPATRPDSLPFSLAAQALLLAANREAATITETYALMKRLSRDFGQRRFHLVVTRVRSGGEARAIYNNLLATASRYLGAALDLLGHVPADDRVRQAERLGRSVAEAFPDCPAAAAIRLLAEAIEAWPCPDEETGRLDAFFNRLVMTSRLASEHAHL